MNNDAMIILPYLIMGIILVVVIVVVIKMIQNNTKEQRLKFRAGLQEIYSMIGATLPEEMEEEAGINRLIVELRKAYIKELENFKETQKISGFHTTKSEIKSFATAQGSFFYGIETEQPLYNCGYTLEFLKKDVNYDPFISTHNGNEQLPADRWFGMIKASIQNWRSGISFGKIPVENIQFYIVQGDVQYASIVSGGGVNLSTAVAGGLLFGDVGAIIGSHIGTETRTDVHTIDNRKILIYYMKDGIPNTLTIQNDIDTTLSHLRTALPEKDALYLSYKQNP